MRRARNAGGTHVAFVADPKDVARWHDIDAFGADDVDALHARFRSGIDAWIAQSYLLLRPRLEARGWTTSFGARYARNDIGVAHWDDLNAYFNGAHRARLVGVRADRSPLHCCARVVVQNDVALAAQERYVPPWQQPGLLPRDPARGARIETIAYFGRSARLASWMRDASFHRALAALGARLCVREDAWHDYHDVDLVISARHESSLMITRKPASKLTNAWLAGVPALLRDEPATLALREGALDYLSITGPEDVLAAIARLRREPARYAAMAENGLRRAAPFAREAVAARWLAVLDEVAAEVPRPPGLLQFVQRVTTQRSEARRFRERHVREQAGMTP